MRIAAVPRLRLRGVVSVIGNGSSTRLLKRLGVTAKRVKRLDGVALRGVRTLLIERGWVAPGSEQHLAVRDFASRGGRVLVLEQDVSLFPSVVLEGKPVSSAFIRAAGHPAFAHLRDDDLREWGEDSYAQVVADTLVAARMYRKDDGTAMFPLCEAGEGGFGTGDLGSTPLFTTRVGRGLVIASQFLITDKAIEHPGALQLLANLLQYADSWKKEAPAAMIEAGNAAPRALVKQAKAGATVLVGPLDTAGFVAWSAATGITLAPMPQDGCYQAVRTGEHPLLDGVSNEDLCGVETWTYRWGEQANLLVCSLAISPVAGLEPVCELPTTALLAEMFVHGGRSEPLRANTRTASLHPKPVPGVVIGVIKVGSGQIVINQFVPPRQADGTLVRSRLTRPANRLRANLGLLPATDLLHGERTASRPAASKGWPTKIQMRTGAISGAERLQCLGDCAFSHEHIMSMPVLRRGKWQAIEHPEGTFTTAKGEQWLYFVIRSPVARQNLATNLGVPNPEALTFCDLTGTGAVELWINGKPAAQAQLPGTLTDLALEQGNNHFLLRWTGGAGQLGVRFRNIMRQAETEFGFA